MSAGYRQTLAFMKTSHGRTGSRLVGGLLRIVAACASPRQEADSWRCLVIQEQNAAHECGQRLHLVAEPGG
jgi:hypothetical protein